MINTKNSIRNGAQEEEEKIWIGHDRKKIIRQDRKRRTKDAVRGTTTEDAEIGRTDSELKTTVSDKIRLS